MEQEIWRPVVGYEGVYEVSNKGRIKSLERIVNTKNRKIHKRESIRNLKKHDGYYYVTLSKNSKHETLAVHRIVAMAFLDKPNGKNHIDHINTIRTDDRVENLRWVTHTENMNNPKTIKNKIVGAATAFKSKKIYVYDTSKSKNGKCVFSFLSPTSAAKYFGVSRRAITKALDNKNIRICGYLIRSERKRYKTKSK